MTFFSFFSWFILQELAEFCILPLNHFVTSKLLHFIRTGLSIFSLNLFVGFKLLHFTRTGLFCVSVHKSRTIFFLPNLNWFHFFAYRCPQWGDTNAEAVELCVSDSLGGGNNLNNSLAQWGRKLAFSLELTCNDFMMPLAGVLIWRKY